MMYSGTISYESKKNNFATRMMGKQKLQSKISWTAVLVFMLLVFPGQLWAQDFQFEAETAILSNGASAQNASACSGGQQVGNIGGTQNGSVTKIFDVTQAGDYDLTLGYCTADLRSVFVWVNYGKRIEISCSPSGGWSIPASTKTQLPLVEGQNTLIFDNQSGWGPNLDQFSLTPSPTFNISGKVELDGAAVAGVLLSLSGEKTATVETGDDGTYSFTTLTSGKNYTITPSNAGQVFNPPYLSFQPLKEEKTEQNFQASASCAECVQEFTFGSSGKINYNTQTGTYSVFYGENEVVSQAHSEVLNGEVKLNSFDYSNREVVIEAITDDFGAGQKITIQLTADNLPAMNQVFYTYADRDYFLTEVSLSGTGVTSNYMAPLVANQVTLAEAGDNRFLSVPFDNDGFVRYKSHSLSSYTQVNSSEVTAFYENNSRNGFVVGSVEHMVWKTGIKAEGASSILSSLTAWGGYTDSNVTRDENAHGSISGELIKSPKLFVGYFDDWRVGMEEYGQANAISEPRYVFNWTQPTPFGWNSWGAIQTNLSLNKAKAVVDFFAQSLPDFRNGETAYVDLDSYWDNMVSGGWEGDFSQLTAFANYCKSKGLKPGIYWGPFVDWGKYDRKVEGSVYSYAAAWTKVNGGYHDEDGGRAMDPTHPATQQRIKFLIDKLIQCGFEMIKIDFIGHAAVEADSYYDPEVTTGMQAFRKGMEYLIDQLDGKMLVYAAISPNLATGRYAHTRRIACDAYSDINATEYTLNSNTYGWWQSQIYNFIDGDHLVLGNSSIGENHARLASGVINGTIINGDDYSTTGQWTERAKTLLQNKDVLDVARDGIAFRPVEGNSEQGASEIFVKNSEGEYDVVIVNYGEKKTFNLSLSRLGIEVGTYRVTELYSGNLFSNQGESIEIEVGAKDASILRFTKGTTNAVNILVPEKKNILYPNPVINHLHLKNNNGIRSLRLTSLDNKLLIEQNNLNRNESDIDMSAFRDGIYLVTIVDLDNTVETFKVIKIRNTDNN